MDLREGLSSYFDLNELKLLCDDLGIDHENLAYTTKVTLAQEMITYLEHRERLDELIFFCRRARPFVDWNNSICKEKHVFTLPTSPKAYGISFSLAVIAVLLTIILGGTVMASILAFLAVLLLILFIAIIQND